MNDPALITAWATVAIALVTGGGAAATCFLIWRGLKAMDRSSDQRKQDRDAALDEARKDRAEARREREEAREADLRRHDETLEALRALIERTGQGAPAAASQGGD